jgi:hypothetical protein
MPEVLAAGREEEEIVPRDRRTDLIGGHLPLPGNPATGRRRSRPRRSRPPLRRTARAWQSASPLTYSQLISAYLARGRWLRALQFLFWMRLSQGHLKASPTAGPPQA